MFFTQPEFADEIYPEGWLQAWIKDGMNFKQIDRPCVIVLLGLTKRPCGGPAGATNRTMITIKQKSHAGTTKMETVQYSLISEASLSNV